MLVKFHVTIVESLIVTTDPCVTRVAYSNSGQPKPQGRGTGPTPQGGRGGGYHGVGGGEGVCGSPASYILIKYGAKQSNVRVSKSAGFED